MRDGVAYTLRLKKLLDDHNEPIPEGIIINSEMFESVEHQYPAICRLGLIFGVKTRMAPICGINVYKGDK